MLLNINDNLLVTFSDELLVKEYVDSCVILNLKNQAYFGLEQESYEFYKILKKEPRVKYAFTQLLEAYDVESSQLASDLIKFLYDLRDAQMITVEKLD